MNEIQNKFYFFGWPEFVEDSLLFMRSQHERNFRTAVALSAPLDCVFSSTTAFMRGSGYEASPNTQTNGDHGTARQNFETQIKSIIEEVESFRYVYYKTRGGSISLICSQREMARQAKKVRLTNKNHALVGL